MMENKNKNDVFYEKNWRPGRSGTKFLRVESK